MNNPKKNDGSQQTAIYLIGQGPLREPRPLELQRFRIERYLRLPPVQEVQGVSISVDDVFVDVNYPRVTSWRLPNAFPALKQLVAAIAGGKYSLVFLDIAPPKGQQLGVEWVPDLLVKMGAEVVNVYDEEQRLLNPILEDYGAAPHELRHGGVSYDGEDMLAFFPALAGRMVSQLTSDIQQQEIPWSIMHRVEQLYRGNPYGAGRFPMFSDIAVSEIRDKKRERAEEAQSKRLRQETLLELTPRGAQDAVLLDDVVLDKPRKKDQWVWVEQRLGSLGFERKAEGRLISFTRKVDDSLVYADPRAEGKIYFYLYELPIRAKATSGLPAFSIPDAWKNNLEEKLLNQIRERRSRVTDKK